MIKIYLYSVISLGLFFSCETPLVLLDSFHGVLTDATTGKPLPNVKIYTDSMANDYFTPITTKEDGYFMVNGQVLPHSDKGYLWRRGMSYTLIFQCPNYLSDTIDLRSFGDHNQRLDTIYLGKIYLKSLDDK